MAKLNKKRVIEALEKCGGIQVEAAENLGCHPGSLSRYIKNNPELKQVIEDAGEAVSDMAETNVIADIRGGSVPTSKWWLETRGKGRGFTKGSVVTQQVYDDELMKEVNKGLGLDEEDFVKKYKVGSVNLDTGKHYDWQGNEIDPGTKEIIKENPH